MPEWTPFQAASETPPTSTVKRSSWNAGMAIELGQLAPPGSPAAWQNRRNSANQEQGDLGYPRLSPYSDSSSPVSASPTRARSPMRHLQVPSLETIRSVSGSALGPEPEGDKPNPFKFTSTYVTPNSGRRAGGARTGASQRRGHHYKHSSVSMNFFQEPEERAPLALPVSLAVPNWAEYWQSVTTPQAQQLAWCALKLCVTLGCYSLGSPVHSMALLAHLLAYETVVSTTVALVAILANFEVWNRSSLRLPFALKRVEVLVAFGLSVVLLFIASDVVSHIVQELGGEHHHHHDHPGDENWRAHYILTSLAVLTTAPSVWSGGTQNVLGLSTLVFAAVVLVIPLFTARLSAIVDTVMQPAIVATMAYLGYSSSKLFGGMLAMSYGGEDRSASIRELVTSDPSVAKVDAVSLWQVHHDLWLATMRIDMTGSVEDERRVRASAERAVQEAVDVRDVVWETTIDIHRANVAFR